MLFHSAQFLLFLPIVYVIYWLVHERARARKVTLFVASMVFYMAWNPAPVILILYLSTVDYWLARLMERTVAPSKRQLLVFLSVSNNLSVLGVFKYGDWIIRSLNDYLSFIGIEIIYPELGLVYPVGLSFIVFQTLSYTVDVYRGDIESRRSWLDVSLYISFFPQVVAGPIVRASDFLPQLDRVPVLKPGQGERALFRILTGMFKKLVIADYLAANLVTRVFTDPENYSGLENIVAVFSYTLQIYYDFSAYSDIAIGVAALFGFTLRENFDKPYLATNLFEFWRRWHISLGRWLFDYLYRPLGGNRISRPITLWNLWVVMLLGSVWHGADWRFVVWGVIHGIVLLGNRIWWWQFGKPKPGRPIWQLLLTGFLTFLIVMEARIVFNASDIEVAWRVFCAQFKGGLQAPNLSWQVCLSIAAAIGGHVMTHMHYETMVRAYIRSPRWAQIGILVSSGLLIKWAMDFEAQPFIYFQF